MSYMTNFEYADAGYNTELWQEYRHLSEELNYSKGEFLLQAGEVPDSIYYLIKGQLRMDYCHIDGTEKTIWYVSENSIIGETPCFLASPSRTSFICTKASRLLRFKKDIVFSDILPTNPDLLQSMFQGLAAKIRILNEQIFMLSFDSVQVRYCKYLYMHAKRLASGEMISRPPLRKNEIAKLFSVHRITLYKAIRQLEEQGILDTGNSAIRIIDEKKFILLTTGELN